LVHISSVTAYGEPPPAESISEGATPRPAHGTYGATKLKQDLDATRFVKKGLDITVLCPPIVTGPHSPQLLGILESLEAGRLFLVEEGSLPCATVDVRNLADLIERSFRGPRADGTRIFALDAPIPTWSQLVQGLREITGPDCATPSISRSKAAELVMRGERKPIRPIKAARHLMSAPVRSALRDDPTWSRVENAAVRFARSRLPSQIVDRIRSQPAPARPQSPASLENADVGQLKRQLRDVWHRPDKARRQLSYEPPITFQQSLSDFASWVERERGSLGEFASLVRYLEK
jgi:nucleoside-diphosphate-sugar epimerase